jgi:urea transport system permease protein
VEIWVAQLFTGVSLASILLLVALGLTFTFGQMNVVNMAHGEFIMAGAYTAYVIQGVLGPQLLGISIPLALVLAFVVAGAIGLLMERTILRRLYARPLDTLVVTWGVSLILQQLARMIFGAQNVEVRAPMWLSGGLNIHGVTFPFSRLFILAVVALSIAAIWFLMNRFPYGRQMRAVVQHRQLALTSGIKTHSVDATTFFVGSGLAGMAGVALTLLGPIGPTLGTNYLVDAFLVVVVGGLGQLPGAVIAALALGLLNASVEFETNASLAKVIVFVAIVAFLQFRPQGLIALRTRALR